MRVGPWCTSWAERDEELGVPPREETIGVRAPLFGVVNLALLPRRRAGDLGLSFSLPPPKSKLKTMKADDDAKLL